MSSYCNIWEFDGHLLYNLITIAFLSVFKSVFNFSGTLFFKSSFVVLNYIIRIGCRLNVAYVTAVHFRQDDAED